MNLQKRVFAALITTPCLAIGLARSATLQEKRPASEHATESTDSPPVFDPGGDVKAPRLVHYVEPEFSTASKEAFAEGTVKISTVVALDGKATRSKVLKGLNAEEDRTALDALAKWKFEPGTKAGKAVLVRVTVEIDFHLL